MNIFKVIILFFLISFVSLANLSAQEESTQDILEKAKEINKKIKKQEAEKAANISKETDNPVEPLPLNDPFVGDASTGGGDTTTAVLAGSDEERDRMSLYNLKLVGIMTGEYESYVSLVNASGEIVTLQVNEELSKGVKLVGLKPDEAYFQKEDETYLVINFKNQIKETDSIY